MSVRSERQGKVLEVVIDRPPVNAIDMSTSMLMGEIFAELQADDDLAVAIVTASGTDNFSAGWDMKAALENDEHERSDFGVGGFGGLTEFFDLTKPVVCALNGRAIGGGTEIVLACDIVVASETATMSLPETSVGVVADVGGVQRLPRKLPYNIAMEMLLTGRELSMAEAAGFGLVNHVVTPARLADKSREVAARIADGAPLSCRAIKEIVTGSDGQGTRESFAALREGKFPTYSQLLNSEDRREGLQAFIQKRTPRWRGR